VTDPESRHLMVIGAYRDNEVDARHPLSTTLGAIRGSAVSEITLGPLERGDVARLCADALHTDVERVGALAELVSEKTGGNPFFATEFITMLADEGLLTFHPEAAAWRWDIDRIRAKGVAENVAELMTAKLNRLPNKT